MSDGPNWGIPPLWCSALGMCSCNIPGTAGAVDQLKPMVKGQRLTLEIPQLKLSFWMLEPSRTPMFMRMVEPSISTYNQYTIQALPLLLSDILCEIPSALAGCTPQHSPSPILEGRLSQLPIFALSTRHLTSHVRYSYSIFYQNLNPNLC